MKLDQFIAMIDRDNRYRTPPTGPILFIHLSTIRRQIREFRTHFPQIKLHYAIKANPCIDVLQAMMTEGVGFDIASAGELDIISKIGAPPNKVIYSNPIKAPLSIKNAINYGVNWFAVDSKEELQKFEKINPKPNLYVRINVPNHGSLYPLTSKFGVEIAEAKSLIEQSKELGAAITGVTFHVGSQCFNGNNWIIGIQLARELFEFMHEIQITPTMLNIGGGFPIDPQQTEASLEALAASIQPSLKLVPDHIELWAEPGRFLVAPAGILETHVIGKARRADKDWLYLDIGLFGGLVENYSGLKYSYHTTKTGKNINWTVAGPTCDTKDIVEEYLDLPTTMEIGDAIYIPAAGAYIQSYATSFNGFSAPTIRLI